MREALTRHKYELNMLHQNNLDLEDQLRNNSNSESDLKLIDFVEIISQIIKEAGEHHEDPKFKNLLDRLIDMKCILNEKLTPNDLSKNISTIIS